jgi:hypothetical protein
VSDDHDEFLSDDSEDEDGGRPRGAGDGEAEPPLSSDFLRPFLLRSLMALRERLHLRNMALVK